VDVLDVARWQFAITTVYHFLMVPLTIGLSIVVAVMQTAWVRTGKAHHLAMTKFWGKLMLVNFAMGVVTGIVQEFQFGMTWSAYSRFVGDVFGAPLAMEGIVAFMVESTFLGLWIFGWERLPKVVHLLCLWAAALASTASAYFILSANSWMQHPVGIQLVDGKPQLTSIWAVLTNNTAIAAFTHTVSGGFAVAGTFLVGIAAWHLWKKHKLSAVDDPDRKVWSASLKLGAWIGMVAFAAVALTGDTQGKLMFEQQPMKMAAAEALYSTTTGAPFSVFAVGGLDGRPPFFSIEIPHLLSILAVGSPNAPVQGIDNLQALYEQRYGPGSYVPMVPVAFWTFRAMIGIGMLALVIAAAYLWSTRAGHPAPRWLVRVVPLVPLLPAAANSLGWIFTETARQPWLAFGI
jgi:cytochrome d ubiquinol oxidase subunit I